MRIFALTVVALLVLSLAGLEMVMSALPDEPVTPAEVRGYALPRDVGAPRPVLCQGGDSFAPVTDEAGPSAF